MSVFSGFRVYVRIFSGFGLNWIWVKLNMGLCPITLKEIVCLISLKYLSPWYWWWRKFQLVLSPSSSLSLSWLAIFFIAPTRIRSWKYFLSSKTQKESNLQTFLNPNFNFRSEIRKYLYKPHRTCAKIRSGIFRIP